MPSRIVFERVTPSHPSIPPSAPLKRDRKSRGLSRFLRKLHIVSHPKIPTPASIPKWTDTGGAILSPCISSRPSSASSSSRCLSSGASSSGNSIHHAFGLPLHSTSTLDFSESGSEEEEEKSCLYTASGCRQAPRAVSY